MSSEKNGALNSSSPVSRALLRRLEFLTGAGDGSVEVRAVGRRVGGGDAASQ